MGQGLGIGSWPAKRPTFSGQGSRGGSGRKAGRKVNERKSFRLLERERAFIIWKSVMRLLPGIRMICVMTPIMDGVGNAMHVNEVELSGVAGVAASRRRVVLSGGPFPTVGNFGAGFSNRWKFRLPDVRLA
jgi:hypothetical protein